MTLVLSLGNADQFVQVSDRRLSFGENKPATEEFNKAVTLVCANARFLVGFSGLAKAGYFDTGKWLLQSLYDCSPPDYGIYELIERFKQKATTDFQSVPQIKCLPVVTKRLSVMFSGYIYLHDPPLAGCAIVSNYQDFKTGIDSTVAWDEFEATYWTERRPHEGELSFVQRIGCWQAMFEPDIDSLRTLLEQRKPVDAIIGKAVALMRAMAERSQAKGTIGKQISAICLPRDVKLPITTSYHTDVIQHNVFFPSHLFAFSKDRRMLATDAKVYITDSQGKPSPVAIPKVSRNQPCPCGSGKKYKFCHGRPLLRKSWGSHED